MPLLHILKGANQGQRVTLDKDRVTLGRNRDCTVNIDFPAVSRVHVDGRGGVGGGEEGLAAAVELRPVDARLGAEAAGAVVGPVHVPVDRVHDDARAAAVAG